MIAARLAPLGLLAAYGIAFGAAAFGLSLPAFDDHPGQLYRLWHVVVRGPAPWAWNPGWWTGYPELQFYPPGFFYLGSLVHAVLTFGQPHAVWPAEAYRALLWLTYLAPGVTTFVALEHLLGSGWAALPGGFIALTLSAAVASGVEGAVHGGMLPARLGWALLPLLALVLVRWRADTRRLPGLAVPVVAGIVLIHPTQLPAAVALVLLAAWSGAGNRPQRVRYGAMVLVLAALLTLFWTLPLVLRLEHARALAWGTLPSAGQLIHQPLFPLLLALAVFAHRVARSPAEGLVARWPWAIVASVIAVALVERLGLHWLPATRAADGAWLAVVLAAGFVLGRLALTGAAHRRARVAALALATIAGLSVLSLPGRTLALWPRAVDWPTLPSVERGLRLGDLWSALRAEPAGRVLFVRSGVPIVFGSEWWRPHTHVTALTPVRTGLARQLSGREIVNGTFTHPSPVAAFLYRGPSGSGALTDLVEQLDGQSLFGRPLETLEAATLERWADRLGISVVVALEEDAPRLRALENNRAFIPRPPVGPFLIFVRREPAIVPVVVDAERWRVAVTGTAGAWVPARLGCYPLWRAERAGARLATRCGEAGDLEVRLDAGHGPVDLIYAAGPVEGLGVALSALGLGLWLVVWRRSRCGGQSEAGETVVGSGYGTTDFRYASTSRSNSSDA